MKFNVEILVFWWTNYKCKKYNEEILCEISCKFHGKNNEPKNKFHKIPGGTSRYIHGIFWNPNYVNYQRELFTRDS